MENYKLLLVDDEEDVIQTIIRKIKWEQVGLTVVGYASNGIKALELVEEYQPDVVMTDIRMPYMDGIEMARQIRQEYPETKIVFFTGFDEFEYAKEAVHLEVEEYILKPANAAELTEAFEKLHNKIEKENNERQNIEFLQKYYGDSLPLLQANFFMSLVEGKEKEEQLEKDMRDYQIRLDCPYYTSIVVHVSANHIPKNLSGVLLTTLVHKVARERLEGKWKLWGLSYLGEYVFLVGLDQPGDLSALTDDCNRLCRYVRRVYGGVVTVGIGSAVASPLYLHQAYEKAREAVSYRAIFGAERAISSQEILPDSKIETANTGEDALELLFKQIRLNAKNELKGLVERYMSSIYYEGVTLEQHQVSIMELVSRLYRFMCSNSLDVSEFPIEKTYQRLLGFDPTSLKNWIYNISIMFCEQIDRSITGYSKSFVSKAIDYIEAHFGDEDLSLDKICQYLGVSNAYFSTVFKKEIGTSFVSYLTQYRMEKAARMIEQGTEKNYVIAQKVGYLDPNYFSYVFKRQFGMSPSKYGAQYAKNKNEAHPVF